MKGGEHWLVILSHYVQTMFLTNPKDAQHDIICYIAWVSNVCRFPSAFHWSPCSINIAEMFSFHGTIAYPDGQIMQLKLDLQRRGIHLCYFFHVFHLVLCGYVTTLMKEITVYATSIDVLGLHLSILTNVASLLTLFIKWKAADE